jgi:hypothetical protein
MANSNDLHSIVANCKHANEYLSYLSMKYECILLLLLIIITIIIKKTIYNINVHVCILIFIKYN